MEILIYALLLAAFAVSLGVYSAGIGLIFLLLSVVQLVLLAILIAVLRLIYLTFQKKARPLRWLAFAIFTVGFFFDLLAT